MKKLLLLFLLSCCGAFLFANPIAESSDNTTTDSSPQWISKDITSTKTAYVTVTITINGVAKNVYLGYIDNTVVFHNRCFILSNRYCTSASVAGSPSVNSPQTHLILGAGYDSGIVNTKAVSGTAYLVNRIYQRAYYQVGTARAGASFDQSWAYDASWLVGTTIP